ERRDDRCKCVVYSRRTGPISINARTPRRRDHFFARTKWWLKEMQTLSLNYTFSDHSSKNNGVGALNLPEQGTSADRYTHRVQLIESAALSPQFRNEIIFVFKRSEERRVGKECRCR